MALRDTIDILDSMNTINKNEYLLQVIEKRKEELQAVATASLLALSAKLRIPDNEIKTWGDLSFDAVGLKKFELIKKWRITSGAILSEINTLDESINTKKRLKTRIVLGTLILQTFGTYLSFIGSGG